MKVYIVMCVHEFGVGIHGVYESYEMAKFNASALKLSIDSATISIFESFCFKKDERMDARISICEGILEKEKK